MLNGTLVIWIFIWRERDRDRNGYFVAVAILTKRQSDRQTDNPIGNNSPPPRAVSCPNYEIKDYILILWQWQWTRVWNSSLGQRAFEFGNHISFIFLIPRLLSIPTPTQWFNSPLCYLGDELFCVRDAPCVPSFHLYISPWVYKNIYTPLTCLCLSHSHIRELSSFRSDIFLFLKSVLSIDPSPSMYSSTHLFLLLLLLIVIRHG